MSIYIELLLMAAITIFIVDVSGFTQSWRDALARLLRVKELRPLPPFDCSLCMTWWVCLAYLLATSSLSIPLVAFSALLSLLSFPMGQLMIFIREGLLALINRMNGRLWN